MSRNRIFKLSTMSAAVASTLIPVHVQAQSALEEVIVTATRRAESIQDIPLNIAALGENTIKSQGLSNLAEAMQWVPGIHIIDQGSRAADQIIVRGLSANPISSSEALGNDGGGTVATYVGEIPVYADLKLNDMARVEVLLGPQGTLYGAGTLAGAIRYIPNKPQFETTEVEVRGNAYQISEADDLSSDVGFTLNLPISDSLAFRMNMDYVDDSGFVDYIYTVREAGVSNPDPDFSDRDDVNANLRSVEDVNTEETLSARAALRWAPNDTFDGTLTYYLQDQESGGRTLTSTDALNIGNYESGLRFVEPSDRKNELIALEMTIDLGFAELTSATGFSQYEESGSRDQTDLLITLEYSYEAFPEFSAFTQEDVDEERFNQEVRLVSTGDGPLRWIAGGFYNQYEVDEAVSREFTPGYDQFLVDIGAGVQLRPDALEYINVVREDTTEWAFFGEITYEFTDRWDVTLGGRYYDYDYEFSSATDFPIAETVFGGRQPVDAVILDFNTAVQDDDGSLFKFNTSYDFSDDVMGYLTYSEGFRLGAGNGLGLCAPDDDGSQTVCANSDEFEYTPDETQNYEIGLRTTWLDQSLTVNGAIYFIEWSDPQLQSATVAGSQPITVNGKGAESTGIEASFSWQMSDNFALRGNYSYSRAELTDQARGLLRTVPDTGTGFANVFVDGEDGDRLPGSPEQQGSIFATYIYPMKNIDLTVNYGISAVGDVLTKAGGRAGGEALPGYAVHNFSAIVATDSWDVTLYADNLLDKYAVTGVRSDTNFLQTAADINGDDVAVRSYGQNVLRPRTIGLRATYRFDM
ncbi:MAG: iron complex outermembrane receptor protein [Halieaceae bacterium]|jgi:iron complex outermembrane receptor protein